MTSLLALTLLPPTPLGCSDYGYTERQYNETFQQADVPSNADVLFVIDNSASMVEEQELLGMNFEAFMDAVEGTYADFQLGVISTDTDGDEAGKLHGGVLTPETDDLAGIFLDAVQVGTSGSRDERGFDAALLATNPDINPGFVRGSAKLNVVVLSDEDDHSEGEVIDIVEDFQSASGAGGFSLHAIVGDLPDGCASGLTAASPGERYLTAAELTGGYRYSICREDFTEVMAQIGLDLSGLQTVFPLAEVPDPESIEVQVDGVVMTERAVDGWTYLAGENAIGFDGHAVPRPGMDVVVSFNVLVGGGEDDAADTAG